MAQAKTQSKASSEVGFEGAGAGNSQLQKFFLDALKDIYWAEKHLTKALPKMHKAATTEALKAAIEQHIAQTETHIARVEQVFDAGTERDLTNFPYPAGQTQYATTQYEKKLP